MIWIFFIPAILFELAYLALFLLTIRLPKFRFWPPPSARSWQFFAAWLIAGLVAVAFFFVGMLDFDSAVLPSLRIRLPFAMLLFLIALVIGTWAGLVFSFRTTLGLGDRLITRGPYRHSRNPQYISDSLSILAFVVLTNSWLTGAIGLLGIVLNLLAPFTEETWLEERFGESYLAYKCSVPRFIGRRTFIPGERNRR